MRLPTPENVSEKQITFDVEEIEPILQAPMAGVQGSRRKGR